MRADLGIGGDIAVVDAVESEVSEVAIDLVGRGEDQRHAIPAAAQRLQQVERPCDVDREIVARIDHARRDRDLRGQVEHRLRVGGGVGQHGIVADVGDHGFDQVAVVRLQPVEIGLHPGTRERVVDADAVAVGGEAIGKVRTDEPGAAGDEDGAIVHNHG